MYSFLRLHTDKNTAPVYIYSFLRLHTVSHALLSYISISSLSTSMYSFLRLHTAKNISIHLCNNSSAYTLLKKFYPSMYSFLRLHTAINTAPVYMYSYIYIHLHMLLQSSTVCDVNFRQKEGIGRKIRHKELSHSVIS